MTGPTPTYAQPKPSRFIILFGAAVLIGVASYYLFMLIDGAGLPDIEGTAIVHGKEYREAGTTYTTQKIGDRMQTIPQSTAEMYVLSLEIEGVKTEAAVDKKLYEEIQMGEQVKVIYQRRRLLGSLQVLKVTR